MIQIDVVLKIGDCEKQMTMDEARNLYFELNRLFNNGMQENRKTIDRQVASTESAKDNFHPDVKKAREVARAKSGGCGGGCGEEKSKNPIKNKAPSKRTPAK